MHTTRTKPLLNRSSCFRTTLTCKLIFAEPIARGAARNWKTVAAVEAAEEFQHTYAQEFTGGSHRDFRTDCVFLFPGCLIASAPVRHFSPSASSREAPG